MIQSRDLFSLHHALVELYAPGLDLENYPQRGMKFLTDMVGVEMAVYGARPVGANVNIMLNIDRPMEKIGEVVDPFGRLAPKYPWFAANFETHDGRPHYRSDFYSDRQYRSLDIHSEVFHRWDHENFMTMCIHATPEAVLFFGSSRTKGDYSPRERSLMALAQPHLKNARRLAVRLSAAKPWSADPGIFSQHGFTPRESEVLYWLTEGKSNVEIGTILRLSLPTVKGYLTSIFNKTGTSNRLAAALCAVEVAKKATDRETIWRVGPLVHKIRWGRPPTKVG